jgi:hypothetical protein
VVLSIFASLNSTPVKQVDLNFQQRDIGSALVDISFFALMGLRDLFGFDLRVPGQLRMFGSRIRFSENGLR